MAVDSAVGHNSCFNHAPVMLEEVLDIFKRAPAGTILDATVGGAGHAKAILQTRSDISLVGFDRDEVALAAASLVLNAAAGERAQVVKTSFANLQEALDVLEIGELAGCLFDLGVSSPQLDNPARGFSYRQDGPLDMRMDCSQQVVADEVVNGWLLEDLAKVIKSYGDERYAKRIARAIGAARPISGTAALAEVIKTAIPAPARRKGGHPAKRTFQAIRIAVNEELAQVQRGLQAGVARLMPEGIGVVISYHSGEDRIVKRTLHGLAGLNDPARFRGLPHTDEKQAPTVELLQRSSLQPSAAEISRNPRASSARLRAFRKLPYPELVTQIESIGTT